MAKIIEMTVNNNAMTQQNKEGYLTSSWSIIMKYIRECNKCE